MRIWPASAGRAGGAGAEPPRKFFGLKNCQKQAKSLFFFDFLLFLISANFLSSLLGRDISGPARTACAQARVCGVPSRETNAKQRRSPRWGHAWRFFANTQERPVGQTHTHGDTAYMAAKRAQAARRDQPCDSARSRRMPAGVAPSRPCAAAAAPCRWRCTSASARSQQE